MNEIERRSTNLFKPFFYFSVEISILILLNLTVFFIHPSLIYVSSLLSLSFLLFSATPRLVKIIDRISEMKIKNQIKNNI